ncbi:MAG TPA: hypothetical protein VM532_05715 [Burkholderiales bacterium]|nr:hypothetical protein [Burkholderiales bacterium]
MAHALDDLFQESDESFDQHRHLFSDQAAFNKFVHDQRELFEQLTAPEHQEQRQLLTEFLNTGEYPVVEPPDPPPQYVGKSLEELLTPSTFQEEVIEGVAYIRLGHLCVESRMFKEFKEACENVAVGNERFVFNRIAALMHGAPELEGSFVYRNKPIGAPIDTAIVKSLTTYFEPRGDWQEIQWNPRLLAIDHGARTPISAEQLLFHEMKHAEDALRPSVAALVRYLTPHAKFKNHDEWHACQDEDRVRKQKGLKTRETYEAAQFSTSTISSTTIALNVSKNDEPEQPLEQHKVAGHLRDDEGFETLLIEDGSNKWRYEINQLLSIIELQHDCSSEEANKLLDEAALNRYQISVSLNKGGAPTYEIKKVPAKIKAEPSFKAASTGVLGKVRRNVQRDLEKAFEKALDLSPADVTVWPIGVARIVDSDEGMNRKKQEELTSQYGSASLLLYGVIGPPLDAIHIPFEHIRGVEGDRNTGNRTVFVTVGLRDRLYLMPLPETLLGQGVVDACKDKVDAKKKSYGKSKSLGGIEVRGASIDEIEKRCSADQLAAIKSERPEIFTTRSKSKGHDENTHGRK